MSISKEKLKEIAGGVDPLAFLDVRDYLQSIFKAIKGSVETYNYLQFSENLGLSKSNVVHLIIRGKRPLTKKAGAKIAEALGLVSDGRIYFENLVICYVSRLSDERQVAYQKLLEIRKRNKPEGASKLNLEFLSEWYHPVIKELIAVSEIDQDSKALAASLLPAIRPEQARMSLKLLQDLNYIEFDEQEQVYKSKIERISTGDEIDSVGVIRFHQKMIDLGKESIFRIEEDDRDISSISMSVSDEVFEKIKVEVQRFRKKILEISEAEKNPSRVVQMNVQLFPMTRKKVDRGA